MTFKDLPKKFKINVSHFNVEEQIEFLNKTIKLFPEFKSSIENRKNFIRKYKGFHSFYPQKGYAEKTGTFYYMKNQSNTDEYFKQQDLPEITVEQLLEEQIVKSGFKKRELYGL